MLCKYACALVVNRRIVTDLYRRTTLYCIIVETNALYLFCRLRVRRTRGHHDHVAQHHAAVEPIVRTTRETVKLRSHFGSSMRVQGEDIPRYTRNNICNVKYSQFWLQPARDGLPSFVKRLGAK